MDTTSLFSHVQLEQKTNEEKILMILYRAI